MIQRVQRQCGRFLSRHQHRAFFHEMEGVILCQLTPKANHFTLSTMPSSNNMIKSPASSMKVDRLSAFFNAFQLSVGPVSQPAGSDCSMLFVTGASDGTAKQIIFCSRAAVPPAEATLVAATVEFGGASNPLMSALPERFVVTLDQVPPLQLIATSFVGEALGDRCGRDAALNRLGEVLVLMVLRSAIDQGATVPGLLAGLADPALHRALVAIHEAPARLWRMDDLALIAGMSRSRFMVLFKKVIGKTPGAYLTDWRLMLGRRELLRGGRVKSVAHHVGFGSAAAFSRAYSRAYSQSPVAVSRSG
ncbi:MAG: AraC family transcriptional regulator [Burkholderiales bacterium]